MNIDMDRIGNGEGRIDNPVAPRAGGFEAEGVSTLRHLGGMVVDNKQFRGLGHDITGCKSSKDILETSGLNWKTYQFPAYVQGAKEMRAAKNWNGLVHGRTGEVLDMVTTKYKPVMNSDMVQQFSEFAERGQLTLKIAGELDHGRLVYAVADTTGTGSEFEIKHDDRKGYNAHSGVTMGVNGVKGDVTRLQVLMVNGHKSGQAFICRAMALREWCANGVTISESAGVLRFTHRGTIDQGAIAEFIHKAIAGFETYESKARRLAAARVTRAAEEAVIIELLQPALLLRAAQLAQDRMINNYAVGTPVDERGAGLRVLDYVMNRDQRLWEPKDWERSTARVIGNLDRHPGHEATEGTLWGTLNAITHDVDHVRGRSPETGLHSSVMGDGNRIKSGALDLVVEYADRLQALGMRQ